MGDSPNVQQGESEEKTCTVYYISDSSDDEYGFNHSNSIRENTDSDSDSDAEKFTLDDFYNKWQSQPCTSMEICEYENDEKRVGLRPGSPEETGSKSSDDGDYDDYWKHVRKSQDRESDDFHIYVPREEQKRTREKMKSPNQGEDKIVEAFIGMIRKRNTDNKKKDSKSDGTTLEGK